MDGPGLLPGCGRGPARLARDLLRPLQHDVEPFPGAYVTRVPCATGDARHSGQGDDVGDGLVHGRLLLQRQSAAKLLVPP